MAFGPEGCFDTIPSFLAGDIEMRLIIILTALLATLAGAAVAQPVDPEPNGIGIYFDEGAVAGSYCAEAPMGTQLTAYLCLTRASRQSGFTAWECLLDATAEGVFSGFSLRGDAVNTGTEPEFVVNLGTPLPYQLSTVLMDITIEVVWDWPIGMRPLAVSSPRGPVMNLPAYEVVGEPGVFHPLQPPFGLEGGAGTDPKWCAGINDDTCLNGPQVDVEETTWGALKALYRD